MSYTNYKYYPIQTYSKLKKIFPRRRERSSIRKHFLANYKELDPADPNDKKPSRVPQQEFTCGGVTINFQMCSNLGNQKKPNEVKTEQPPPPAYDDLKV